MIYVKDSLLSLGIFQKKVGGFVGVASPGFQALILEERHIEALPSECFGSNKMRKGWVSSTQKQGNFEFLL